MKKARTVDSIVRRCDICGTINAIDLSGTLLNEEALKLPNHTVLRLPRAEAVRLWATAGKCDHKRLIESLRSQNISPLTPPPESAG